MRRLILGCLALVLVAVLAAPAAATASEDYYYANLDGYNNVLGYGDGSGWTDDTGHRWFYYEESNSWKQWFYDDPPNPDCWKEGYCDMTLSPNPIGQGSMFYGVSLSWSNMSYGETGSDGPPPMPGQDSAIESMEISSGTISGVKLLEGPFLIEDYNPEWIAIDVWFSTPYSPDTRRMSIDGTISHDCVPEPASMVLLGMGLIGGLAVFAWRRRRR